MENVRAFLSAGTAAAIITSIGGLFSVVYNKRKLNADSAVAWSNVYSSTISRQDLEIEQLVKENALLKEACKELEQQNQKLEAQNRILLRILAESGAPIRAEDRKILGLGE